MLQNKFDITINFDLTFFKLGISSLLQAHCLQQCFITQYKRKHF